MSLPENPLFGYMIGQRIGDNAQAAADAKLAGLETMKAEGRAERAESTNKVLEGLLERAWGDYFDASCITAGVRGVVRELLTELRRADPSHPLLEKKVRDRVFDSAHDAQSMRGKEQTHAQRVNDSGAARNSIYGAEGSGRSGPENDSVTPNTFLRKAAGVPEDHITDREKLLGLVAALTAELHEVKPDAQILAGKEMRKTFDEFIASKPAQS